MTNEPAYLFLENSEPKIQLASGSLFHVPNSPFGAWFIRSRFNTLNATDEGIHWYSKFKVDEWQQPENLVLPPRHYQILGLYRMSLGNTGLYWDMGTGKTFVSLAFILKLIKAEENNINLILCPLSLFSTWQDEIAKHYKNLETRVIFAHGTKTKHLNSLFKLDPVLTFVITTYESLKKYRETIQELKPRSIFLDECQKVKNLDAARTQDCHKLIRNLSETPIYELSGTPSTTKVLGYYSLLELLQVGASGHSNIKSFEHDYITSMKFYVIEKPENGFTVQKHMPALYAEDWLKKNKPGYEFYFDKSPNPAPAGKIKITRIYPKITGTQNLDKLKQITDTWTYALKKTDVLNDLPDKIYQRRIIKMSPEQEKAYDEVLTTNRAELLNTKLSFTRLNAPHIKLQQIANGYLSQNDEDYFFEKNPKLEALKDIIEEACDDKVVIWSPFIPSITQIQKMLESNEIEHVCLHGKIREHLRPGYIREFQNNPNCQVLLANPSVGGIGLNLQCAHIEVFATNWCVPDVRAQAEDRLYRSGQKNAVSVIDLIAENTLENKILNSLINNINLENQLLSIKDLTGAK